MSRSEGKRGSGAGRCAFRGAFVVLLCRAAAGGVVVLCLAAACSEDTGQKADPTMEPVDGDGTASGDGVSVDFDNNATRGDGDADGAGDGQASPAPDPDCVGEVEGAREVPVDMYIMLDKSGSMNQLTPQGPSKWEAILDALTAFVTDSESDGLGVGLQYFPLQTPGVPESCTADDDCGSAGGQCLNRACLPSPNADFQLCRNILDCPLLSPGCQEFGTCEDDATFACFDIGPTGCAGGPNPNVPDLGACQSTPAECSFCASCEVDDYATPAVEIASLPGNAQAIIDSLNAQTPRCFTPTSSALAGAVTRAADQALQNPGHRVLVVLATDGTPTDCLPIDINAVAGIAGQGVIMINSILTYVIGVFTPQETQAQDNLDLIARTGGTANAFIVDPGQDVAQQFQDALSEIRGGTLDCEFQLPAAPAGQSLDYNRVNVELTEGDETRSLLYVETPANCDQAQLGWYYDQVPGPETDPAKIETCPDACDALRAATEGTVSIRLGCQTVRPD